MGEQRPSGRFSLMLWSSSRYVLRSYARFLLLVSRVYFRRSSQRQRARKRYTLSGRHAKATLNSPRIAAKVSVRIGSLWLVTTVTSSCSPASRHLYALYCLLQRERENAIVDDRPLSPVSTSSSSSGSGKPPLPAIFSDPGWSLLNTSILSTSNCGNPALRLFGFGPVAADGYGIGYIIKDEGVSV